MAKKVLVRSRIRHVRARTTRTWARDEKGTPVSRDGFRQFIDHHAYMTPAEAAFLIDSRENQRHVEAGLPPQYYYPAGAPLPVDENKDGSLEPPLTDSSGLTNSDQAEAARLVMAEAERSLASQDRVPRRDTRPLADEPSASRIDEPIKIVNPDAPGDDDELPEPGAEPLP